MNAQTLKGNWNSLRGKVKEKWGQLTDDELNRTEGNLDQVIGLIQRKTGDARTRIEDFLEQLTDEAPGMINRIAETAQEYAGAAAETVQNAAHQAYDTARSSIQATQQMVRRNPIESLSISFCAGLVSGVVVGLMIRSR